MIRLIKRLFFLSLTGCLVATCQARAVTPAPTLDTRLVFTFAAATVYAHTTQIASASISPPQPFQTLTPWPTPLPIPAQIAVLLPPECEKLAADVYTDPSWQYLTRDYGEKGCKLPLLSPDGKYLAYVTLKRRKNETGVYFVDTLRILLIGPNAKDKEAYIAYKMNYIAALEWSPAGQLIFWEQIWEGPRVVFVYDPVEGAILTGMRVNEDAVLQWNPQHTAFYARRSSDGYGADVCVGELGGYDFEADKQLPDLYKVFNIEERENDPFDIPYGRTDNLYIEPFGWSQDGKSLWLTVTPLNWKESRYEVGPRQAGVLEFSETGVTYISLAADAHYDYSFEGLPDPKLISQVYQPRLCP
jgi:hypothetical protein